MYEIKINVELNASASLEALLRQLFGLKEPKKPTEVDGMLQQLKAREEKIEEMTVKADVAEQPKAEVKAEPKQENTAKTYTAEDVRTAMHECRVRFEGPDYKENTESEGYKKYHKSLTSWFKYLSATYNAERPSELAVEYRKGFIEDCAETILDDEGKFMVPRLSNANSK